MGRFADHSAAAWVLGAVAFVIAAIGAKPYAGSWNDGCRLAAVESLLDRGTLAIDDSIFVKPPQRLIDAGHPPYDPKLPHLMLGTQDKLYVRGHFHSDKPAVISILMAAAYEPFLWLGVPMPGERPDIFCRLMTLLTSGLGYAVAVGCMWVLGGRVGLEPRWRLVWLAAFALGTFAPTYTEYVNTHSVQLSVVAAMCVLLTSPAASRWSLIGLGTLAGFGFNLDFGSGPPLVACTFAAVAWRTRSLRATILFTSAALPWIAAGMGVNFAIGGVWKPINMYPEHYRFPGTPFTEQNLTGFMRHDAIGQLLYAGGLLFGKHGFLNHNLPLLLLLIAGVPVLLRQTPPPNPLEAGRGSQILTPLPASGRGRGRGLTDDRPGLIAMLGAFTATWMLYAVLSNNNGGMCCSIRWFLPFLAPGFWLLALILRDRPNRRSGFLVLSAGGAILAGSMWLAGPWTMKMVPLMWPIVGVTLLVWGVNGWHRWRIRRRLPITDVGIPTPSPVMDERRAA